ncbi:MAG TPA: hypothetical protein DEB06_09070 [Phycisphaerales bacterium]|nr:hypothetical protein [Phycisphaerales bacterium]
MHTLYLPDFQPGQPEGAIEGDEARHGARVKRLAPGDLVRVLNGRGLVVLGRLTEARRRLAFVVERWEETPPLSPAVEVWSATPKGARVEELVDALVQVGAASWTPMACARSVVDPRDAKLARLERIATEALKQAARPWAMSMREKSPFAAALDAPAGTALVIADASGQPCRPSGEPAVRLLIGPEGGFTPEELRAARDAGARVCALGAHTMRIELAAPVGVALILREEQRRPRNPDPPSQEQAP